MPRGPCLRGRSVPLVYLTSLTQIPAYLYLGPRIAFHFGG
jgi:hypothetical protein